MKTTGMIESANVLLNGRPHNLQYTKNPEDRPGIFVCIVCISQRTNTTAPFASI